MLYSLYINQIYLLSMVVIQLNVRWFPITCINSIIIMHRSLPEAYCCYGYSIDLLEKMSKDLEFDFHLYLVADGTFGSQKIQWNGVVGDLVSGSAHMAFCPLSVTSTRFAHNPHIILNHSKQYTIYKES